MNTKTINFQGQAISPEEARKLIEELKAALASTAPELSETPVGQQVIVLNDPRWYTTKAADGTGSVICFRDPALGWNGFHLPWASVGVMISLLTNQMTSSLNPALTPSDATTSETKFH